MEVKIISEELVKPSSPTPQHLRTFGLSLLTQLIPLQSSPVIFFYPNSEPDPSLEDVQWKLDLLKESLSRTLTRFYPLAGKIRDGGLYVKCDDTGARYISARADISLSRLLAVPDLVYLNKLMPYETGSVDLTHPVNIQVNVFECGGIAIGVCTSHKLHDGSAVGAFMNEWVASARDSSNSPLTDRELNGAADLFPANDLWLKNVVRDTFSPVYKTGNCTARRFVFSGEAVEALRALGKGPDVENPTRVEAVSGFLWKCVMEACRRKNDGFRRPSTFSHLVNIRARMNPPVSGFSLGNHLWWAIAQSRRNVDGSHYHADDTLPWLVCELRVAISGIDGQFISGLSQEKNSMVRSLDKFSGVGSSGEADHVLCTSWTRMGLYDADFGWGTPGWVSRVWRLGTRFFDLICLVSTRSGVGMEAWVILDEQEMSLLLEDPELQSFASVNPNPLTIGSNASGLP